MILTVLSTTGQCNIKLKCAPFSTCLHSRNHIDFTSIFVQDTGLDSAGMSSPLGMNLRAPAFMQYLFPVGLGPSLKTCPRCAPDLASITSVRGMKGIEESVTCTSRINGGSTDYLVLLDPTLAQRGKARPENGNFSFLQSRTSMTCSGSMGA